MQVTAVQTDVCSRDGVYVYVSGAPYAYVLVAQKPAGKKQPKAVEELGKLGSTNHAQVQLSVVGNGARREAVPVGRTDTEHHGAAFEAFAVEREVYLEIETLEEQQEGRRQMAHRCG